LIPFKKPNAPPVRPKAFKTSIAGTATSAAAAATTREIAVTTPIPNPATVLPTIETAVWMFSSVVEVPELCDEFNDVSLREQDYSSDFTL